MRVYFKMPRKMNDGTWIQMAIKFVVTVDVVIVVVVAAAESLLSLVDRNGDVKNVCEPVRIGMAEWWSDAYPRIGGTIIAFGSAVHNFIRLLFFGERWAVANSWTSHTVAHYFTVSSGRNFFVKQNSRAHRSYLCRQFYLTGAVRMAHGRRDSFISN